ncbi:UNVERIFIED_CONTAM: hypothetical protein FKN15_044295 [Acipenser sinensis]
MPDDSISGASASDVQDRLSSLELRVQQQEDEITVLRAALADVLRRLALSEDQAAAMKKMHPGKDDSISGASASDVQDRLSSLELRVQQQEDEITVLRAALADVLRRLALSEDQAAAMKKMHPGKGKRRAHYYEQS